MNTNLPNFNNFSIYKILSGNLPPNSDNIYQAFNNEKDRAIFLLWSQNNPESIKTNHLVKTLCDKVIEIDLIEKNDLATHESFAIFSLIQPVHDFIVSLFTFDKKNDLKKISNPPIVLEDQVKCALLVSKNENFFEDSLEGKVEDSSEVKLIEKSDFSSQISQKQREQLVEILKKTEPDSIKENSRLRTIANLEQRTENRLKESINNNLSLKFPSYTRGHKENISNLQLQAELLYFKAFAIKKVLKETHYVFLHSQSTCWSPLTILLQEFFDDKKVKYFKFLNATQILKGNFHPSKTQLMESLTKNENLTDHDSLVRTLLLSVDGCFLNDDKLESAFNYFLDNSNQSSLKKEIIESFLIKFYPLLTQSEASNFASQLFNILKIDLDKKTTGNLIVIAVNKKNSSEAIYMAKKFGKPYEKLVQLDEKEILDKLQNETLLLLEDQVPQHRIFLPALDKDKDCVFYLTNQSKNERKTWKIAIRKIISEIRGTIEGRSNESFDKSFSQVIIPFQIY